MHDKDRHDISLSVNGEPYRLTVESRRTLADVLRHDVGLTGTHLGCEHGVCGACSVIVDGALVRACLVFGVQVDGSAIETVEGLSQAEDLSALQQAFADNHGLQCGFCTPGFLMLATAFLRDVHDPTDEQIRETVASNLCRCTGYQGILDAVRQAADALAAERRQDAGGQPATAPAR
jgi:aerobic-type carbon monoxide dehydrogenase small subunit (CoxS/CutS family)